MELEAQLAQAGEELADLTEVEKTLAESEKRVSWQDMSPGSCTHSGHAEILRIPTVYLLNMNIVGY